MVGEKQKMAPMWQKLMQDVDLEEPAWFHDHVHLGCAQLMQTKWNTCWTAQGDVEWRISAGATEKITRAGKTSRKNCCVVLWHGRTGSKMRWVVLWTGKKLEQLYKDSSPSLLGCKHHTYLYARRRTFVSCAPHSARFMQPNPTPKHRLWAQLLQLPERRATPINLRDSFPCRDDATIISAAEDPEVPHSGGSRSSKETAVSRLPPCWDR